MGGKIIGPISRVSSRATLCRSLAIWLFLSSFFSFGEEILARPLEATSKALEETISAARQERPEFPGTDGGKMAQAFWRAFERSDAVRMEAFFLSSLPPEKLKQIPARERARRLLELRQKLGKELRLIFINSSAPEEVTLFLASAEGEMFRLGLTFETQEKKVFLKALTVDEATPEDMAPSLPPMTLDQALEGIEQEIEKAAKEDLFSGVVLIARDFLPLFFKPYGFASKEFSAPNRIDTRFNLGSINKIFTKIAIGQLAEKGWLSLDDKLGRFLPDYPNPEAREKVTVRHLVNMTSGIGDFFGPEFRTTPKDFIRHNRDYLKLFAAKPLAFEPGTRALYSNGGYVVLGEIISVVSGMDYYDFIFRNIFAPAGMKNSDWLEADAVVENVAEGYTRESEGGNEKRSEDTPASDSEKRQMVGGKRKAEQKKTQIELLEKPFKENSAAEKPRKAWRRNIYTRPARGSAAGGGYSTAEDLLRFICALAESRLLGEAWTEWIFTGVEPSSEEPGFALSDKKNNLEGESDHGGGFSSNSPSTSAVRQLAHIHPAEDKDRDEEANRGSRGKTYSAILSSTMDEEAASGQKSNFLLTDQDNGKFSTTQSLYAFAREKVQTQNSAVKKTIERSRWNLALAGGAPGINAVLEFDGGTGYTVIVLSNYDPPAATRTARMIRRFLQAVKIKE